jgi:hypothetical protein
LKAIFDISYGKNACPTATTGLRSDTCRGDMSLGRDSRARPWLIERIAVDC